MSYSSIFAPSSAAGHPVRTGLVRFANRILRVLPPDRPTVDYDLAGFSLKIPLNHPLPRVLATSARYLQPLRLLGEAVAEHHGDAAAIDVGANVGDTAAILAQSGCVHVVCVEGNPAFLPVLRSNAQRAAAIGWRFDIVDRFVAIGDEPQQVGIDTKYGTSRLVTDAPSEHTVTIETVAPATLLDGLERVSVLKIDTDGMDLDILRAFVRADADKIRSVFVEFTPGFEAIGGTPQVLAEHGLDILYWFDHLGTFVCSSRADDSKLATDLARYAERTGAYYDIVALRSDSPEGRSFAEIVDARA